MSERERERERERQREREREDERFGIILVPVDDLYLHNTDSR